MVHKSILHFWLDSLGLGHHLSTFVDHGYDHLEICKQVCVFLCFLAFLSSSLVCLSLVQTFVDYKDYQFFPDDDYYKGGVGPNDYNIT